MLIVLTGAPRHLLGAVTSCVPYHPSETIRIRTTDHRPAKVFHRRGSQETSIGHEGRDQLNRNSLEIRIRDGHTPRRMLPDLFRRALARPELVDEDVIYELVSARDNITRDTETGGNVDDLSGPALVDEPARSHGISSDNDCLQTRSGRRDHGADTRVGAQGRWNSRGGEVRCQPTPLHQGTRLGANHVERGPLGEGLETNAHGPTGGDGRDDERFGRGAVPLMPGQQQIGEDPRQRSRRASNLLVQTPYARQTTVSDRYGGGVPHRGHRRLRVAERARDGTDGARSGPMGIDQDLHCHAGQGRGSRQMIGGYGAHALAERRGKIRSHDDQPVHVRQEPVRS